jgi:hypothetical protein
MNLKEGDEKIRRLLKAMWLRKKRTREERERRRIMKAIEISLRRHLSVH